MLRVCSIVLLFLYFFLFISTVFKSLVLEALVVVAAYLCLSLSSVIKLYYELYLLFRDTDCKVGMARSPIYVISCVLFRCNIHVHVLSLSNETIKKKLRIIANLFRHFSSKDVSICCFSSSLMTVHEVSFGSGLLVGLKKKFWRRHFELWDILMSKYHNYLRFYMRNRWQIWWSELYTMK